MTTGAPDIAPPEEEAAAAPPAGDELVDGLLRRVEGAKAAVSQGDQTIRVEPDRLLDLAEAAHEAGFEMCVDITAADYLGRRPDRFELVVNLLSVSRNRRLRILAALPEKDPTAPSLTSVYPGANFLEREAYDMFGIRFDGHPDLTRILMPDDWIGHPLRKDFATGEVPVQFKEAPSVT